MNLLAFFDTSLFLVINHLPHTWAFDQFAGALSGIGTGALMWLVLGALLVIKERKHAKFFLQLLIVIGISFVLSEVILKPLFGRGRPGISLGTTIVGTQA
jgi:hypothetical protein